MSYDSNIGLGGVHNQYGVRNTGTSAGVEYSDNSESILSVELTSSSLGDGFVPPIVVPKGAHVIRALLTVSVPITITASSTFHVGGSAPATNGVSITTANLATVGTVDLTSALLGTWATSSSIAADEKVTCDAAAGLATAPNEGGVANLSVKYVYKNRLHSYSGVNGF